MRTEWLHRGRERYALELNRDRLRLVVEVLADGRRGPFGEPLVEDRREVEVKPLS